MINSRKIFSLICICAFLIQSVSAQKGKDKKPLSDKERLKFESLYINAGKSKILEDYEQAIKLYEACEKLDPSQPAPIFELSMLYMHFGEVELALEYSQKAAEMDPENFYYRVNYAEILKSTQQLDKALKEFQKMAEDFPKKYLLKMDIAVIYIAKKQYLKAIEVYDELEKTIGKSEELIFKKQHLYLQAGKVEKAAEEIEGLIELNPENPNYYVLLAEIYAINEFDDKALKAYKKGINKFPEDATLQLSLSEFYRLKKQYSKAFEHVNIAFKSKDLEIDQKVKTVLSYFEVMNENSNYEKQISMLGETLLEVHPDDARVLTINGDINLNLSRPRKARLYFMKAVEVDPGRFPIWSQLLILEADLAIYDTLAIHSEEAAALFPNQPLCFYFAGFAYSQLNEHEKAANSYSKGIQLVVGNDLLKVQFYLGLADAYNNTKDHELSDEAFESVLSLDSNNTLALNNYSYYLSVRGEHLERAKTMSLRSNSLEPNQATYLDTYAWILYKMNDFEEAKIWMQKALDNGGSSSDVILEHMGDICFQLGEKKEAIKYWQKAIEKGEGSEFLKRKVTEGLLYE